MNISILGSGGWGTANAILLTGIGHHVTLWSRSADTARRISETRKNTTYLPNATIPESVHVTASPAEAMDGADAVVLAVPSRFLAETCRAFSGLMKPDTLTVSLTKGFCEKSHRRMSELAGDILGTRHVVVLSGPTHAEEVALGIPTAIVAAAADIDDARTVQSAWNCHTFRVYTSNDPVGVETGGAVKNIIAIAVGCSDGLGFGDNTRAALITRGLAEMSRFAVACGANPQTMSGLSGMGDLIVTCTSGHSRNRAVGERLGRGEPIDAILSSMKMVAEGVWNAHVVREMAESLGVDMPITNAVYGMCHGNLPVSKAISSLMNRPLKGES